MEMPPPLVSVIIPSLNRLDFVKNLLADLRAQDFDEFEVLVIDQSDTPYFLSAWECRYFHLRQKGPCNARDFGVRKSAGKVLVFLDDDARIDKDFLRLLAGPILKGDEVASCGAICGENGKHAYAHFGEHLAVGRQTDVCKDLFSILTSNPDSPDSGYCMSFPIGCSAILAEFFQDVGGIDLAFDPNGALEDRDLAFRILKRGKRIRFVGDAKLYHLGASEGGRRGVKSESELLSDYSFNLLYLTYKHFGEHSFNEQKLGIFYRHYLKTGLLSRSLFRIGKLLVSLSAHDLPHYKVTSFQK